MAAEILNTEELEKIKAPILNNFTNPNSPCEQAINLVQEITKKNEIALQNYYIQKGYLKEIYQTLSEQRVQKLRDLESMLYAPALPNQKVVFAGRLRDCPPNGTLAGITCATAAGNESNDIDRECCACGRESTCGKSGPCSTSCHNYKIEAGPEFDAYNEAKIEIDMEAAEILELLNDIKYPTLLPVPNIDCCQGIDFIGNKCIASPGSTCSFDVNNPSQVCNISNSSTNNTNNTNNTNSPSNSPNTSNSSNTANNINIYFSNFADKLNNRDPWAIGSMVGGCVIFIMFCVVMYFALRPNPPKQYY